MIKKKGMDVTNLPDIFMPRHEMAERIIVYSVRVCVCVYFRLFQNRVWS